MTETILVVEDHPLYCDALVNMIRSIAAQGTQVRSARSAEEAIGAARVMQPLRLVVMDLGLPGLNGVEAIRRFKQVHQELTIIIVSASEDRHEAVLSLRAGAAAFISKATAIEVIMDIIKSALSGSLGPPQWITPAGQLLVSMDTPLQLTARQSEILSLLMQGQTNKEICLTLGIAEVTVKMHMSAIFRSLGVINRTQAVIAARRMCLYQVEDLHPC